MMKLNIKVVPNAKKNRLVEEPGRLNIYLAAPAVEGKANSALVEFLAEHFKVRKGTINIVKGARSREKIVEIG